MTKEDVKFWLEEKDLKTPEHDEIVLWTFNNAQNILKQINIMPKLESQKTL